MGERPDDRRHDAPTEGPPGRADEGGYAVAVRAEPARMVASIRAVVPVEQLVAFFEESVADLTAHVHAADAAVAGRPWSAWHSAPDEIPGASDVEVCLPVEGVVAEVGRVRVSESPAHEVAYTVHAGPYDSMHEAFDAVWVWIHASGRTASGPPRDTVLVGPSDTRDPQAYRTEVSFPVAAASAP